MATALVLSFAVLLLIGVLISERAHRTVLSTAVLFLVGGFLLGPGALGVIIITSSDPIVGGLAELALFSVLFTDGMRVGFRDLRAAWRLPGRALLLGLPLTLALTAVFAHYIAGLPWLESFLLGAILAPTDPVFAAAIVGREEVPGRLRHLLNVESGVNDGLALPIVLILLAAAGGGNTHGEELLFEIVLGIAVGIIVPVIVLGLERLPFLQAIRSLQPLLAVSIGLLVLAICQATHANLFLGAFAAGITVATFGTELRHEFEQFGELLTDSSIGRHHGFRRPDHPDLPLRRHSPCRLGLRHTRPPHRQTHRSSGVLYRSQTQLRRTGHCDVVRPERLRFGRLWPDHPQIRHCPGRPDLPPGRPRHHPFHPVPLLHRRRHRPQIRSKPGTDASRTHRLIRPHRTAPPHVR